MWTVLKMASRMDDFGRVTRVAVESTMRDEIELGFIPWSLGLEKPSACVSERSVEEMEVGTRVSISMKL